MVYRKIKYFFAIIIKWSQIGDSMNILDVNNTFLITGGAGFIGYHLSKSLLDKGAVVIGFDNMSDYYDVSLKEDRLKQLKEYNNYTFVEGDLADKAAVENLFVTYVPDIVVSLGGQAGVRYSIDNPSAYIQSNIVGFFNVIEACRFHPVKHLLYASSSSVYGTNAKIPFSTTDQVDTPVSLYAATKKTDELIAYAYCKLYGIKATGLRFFTVYGPMGRPDMAYFKFAKKIMAGEPIQIYNNGDMMRDFTYVDDIVEGIENILCNPPVADKEGAAYKIYNIGNNRPEKLMDFITILEKALGKEAVKEFYPMQPGDVYQTYADVSELMKDFNFRPDTPLEVGIGKFVTWFKEYYHYE